MEMQIARPGMGPRSTTMMHTDTSVAQLKADLILQKRKNLRLEKKEKRIQVSRVPFVEQSRQISGNFYLGQLNGRFKEMSSCALENAGDNWDTGRS